MKSYLQSKTKYYSMKTNYGMVDLSGTIFYKSYFTATSGWSNSKRETRHFINQVTIQQQKLFGYGHMHPSSLHAFLDSFQTLLWHPMMASQKVMFLLIS